MMRQSSFFRRCLLFSPILLLAFALRVWDINARSLWFDEAFEYWSANAPFWEIPGNVLTSYQPPLYIYLLHMWLKFGIEAVWLRFLSVGLSMLNVVGVMIWGHRLSGPRGALIAGGMAAILPSEVRYAQEVGEYALMGCALTWALIFLDYASDNPRWRFWGLWGLFSVISAYTHYGTIIVVASSAMISLIENLWRGKKQAALQQVAVSATILLLCLPLFGFFLPRQVQELSRNLITIPVHSLSTEIARFVDSIGNTFLFQLTGWPFSTIPKWIGTIEIALIFALSLSIIVRPSARMQKRSLWWFLVAYICYFVAVRSGLYAHGNYGFRYALILAPLFVLAVVASVEQLVRWRQILGAFVIFSVIVGLGVYSLPNRTLSQITRKMQAWPETEDMREVTQYWMEHRSNDPTYIYYGAAPAFRYYLQLYGLDTGPLPPRWHAACWEGGKSCPNEDGVFFGTWLRHLDPPAKVEAIEHTLGDWPQRLWIIFSHLHPDEDRQILDLLVEEMGYSMTLSNIEVNASAYLLERK
ncbi:MAG: glycosyltransferase family 39 protein [Chloroflexota bacterium]|nr:glycosyltransferase family 39 protein [Chloroflexota bacterium]